MAPRMESAGGAGRLKSLMRPVLSLLAAIFVVYAGWDLWSRWNASAVRVVPGWALAAWLPAALAMALQFVAWRSLLCSVTGRSVPWKPALVVYLDSQMARYTPGKIGLPVVRIAGAGRLGVAARTMASTLLVELASWCATGLLVGASFSVWGIDKLPVTPHVFWIMCCLVVVSVLGLLASCSLRRKWLPAFVLQTFLPQTPGDEPQHAERPLVPWRLPAWHVLHWSCWVAVGACLNRAVSVQGSAGPLVGGVLCLAIVVGFLALLAPAGAGVREVVLAWGVAPGVGAAPAVALGLLARVASLGTDVLLWAAARLLLNNAPSASPKSRGGRNS